MNGNVIGTSHWQSPELAETSQSHDTLQFAKAMRNKRAAGISALDLTTRARLLEAWLALTIGLEVPPSHFKNTQGHNILLNPNT